MPDKLVFHGGGGVGELNGISSFNSSLKIDEAFGGAQWTPPLPHRAFKLGNTAPSSTADGSEVAIIYHNFSGTMPSTTVMGLEVVTAVTPLAASTTLVECIDATVVSNSVNHTGSLQTITGAISIKATATAKTQTSAACFVAWPGYELGTNVTLTSLIGFQVIGTTSVNNGTRTNIYGFKVDANALTCSADKIGLDIGAFTGSVNIAAGARIVQPLGGVANHALWLENSASTPPTMIWRNVAQSTITITIPTSITSWTLTLPPDDGDATEHLQTNGSGVTTWENPATSTRTAKIIEGILDPEVALQRVRENTVYLYRYDPNVKHVGGDYRTLFAHGVTEESPWWTRTDGKSTAILSELGHHGAAIAALADKLDALEAKVA